MEIPLFNLTKDEKVLITPVQQLENLTKNMNLKESKLPKKCIFSAMNPKRVEKFIDLKLIKEISSGYNPGAYPYKIYVKDNEEFVVVYAGGIGPSAMANTLEIIIAMGVEEVYLIGLGGGMTELDVGEIVIGVEAIRDEGVSYHYIDKSKMALPSKKLLEKMKELIPMGNLGKIWTTDSMYRETHNKFLKHKELGALAVDMETASAYAIAEFRKIDFISCLVISDNVKLENWIPSFNSEKIDKSVEKIVKAILKSF